MSELDEEAVDLRDEVSLYVPDHGLKRKRSSEEDEDGDDSRKRIRRSSESEEADEDQDDALQAVPDVRIPVEEEPDSPGSISSQISDELYEESDYGSISSDEIIYYGSSSESEDEIPALPTRSARRQLVFGLPSNLDAEE